MKKGLLYVVSVLMLIGISNNNLQAQDYTSAFGVKIGKFASGVTFKQFFGASASDGLEANLTVKKNFGTAMITALYQKQGPIRNRILQAPIDWNYGAGIHVAMYKAGYYRIRNGEKDTYYGSGMSAGIDLRFGLEHPFANAPLTLGLELNPFYDIINPGPEWLELALSLRFMLN